MPHLKSLNLGFGKLNFAQIPRQLEDAHHNSKTNIQVKVDKNTSIPYNTNTIGAIGRKGSLEIALLFVEQVTRLFIANFYSSLSTV